jgi:hypothetical protein
VILADHRNHNSAEIRECYGPAKQDPAILSRNFLLNRAGFGARIMRRTVFSLVLGVIVTGQFLSGLLWMTSLQERGWSKDSKVFGRQAAFVGTLLSTLIGASVWNHVLNRRRYSGASSTTGNPNLPHRQVSDHPLHDCLLDD